MKKILRIGVTILGVFIIVGVDAYKDAELDAARQLSENGVIEIQKNANGYKLDDTITRREMIKIISRGQNYENCNSKFLDLKVSDWGCKYAEYALSKGYISNNKLFRPDDDISQIEALKIIMRLYNVDKLEANDWRAGYLQAARGSGIVRNDYFEYDKKALRGWIFQLMVQMPIRPLLKEGEFIRVQYSTMGLERIMSVFNTKKYTLNSELDESENVSINVSESKYNEILNAMNALSREPLIFVPEPGVLYDGTFRLILIYDDGTIVQHTSTNPEIEAFLDLIEELKK